MARQANRGGRDGEFFAEGPGDNTLQVGARELLIQEMKLPEREAEDLRRRPSCWTEPLQRAVRGVHYSAVTLGLLLPGKLGQEINWGAAHGAYQFTCRGLEFFKQGTMSVSTPGYLVERIEEVAAREPDVALILPLVEEAQRCWSLGCLRASVVLIGLAVEDTCLRLLDEVHQNVSPPGKASSLHSDWSQCTDATKSFYARWKPGTRILDAVKSGLRKSHGSQKPDWMSTWEPIPGAIEPYGEYVRLARNRAAHSVDDIFTPADVGLRLATLPFFFDVVGDLSEFLREAPKGVAVCVP